MIALIRVRATAGAEEAVRRALAHAERFHAVPGLLGLEVYAEREGSFWLLSRWADEPAWRAWEGRHDHLLAVLAARGELDPSETRIVTATRVPGGTLGGPDVDWLVDHAEAFAGIAVRGACTAWAHADAGGRVLACNDTMRELLAAEDGEVRPLLDCLTPRSRAALEAWRAHPDRERRLIAIFDGLGQPTSLVVELTAVLDGFLMVGEPPWPDHRALEAKLTTINNELTKINRAYATQARQLERARGALQGTLEEVHRSNWLVRRIAEYLPLCARCHAVRGDEANWRPLAEFLAANGLDVTHGLCPTCLKASVEALEG